MELGQQILGAIQGAHARAPVRVAALIERLPGVDRAAVEAEIDALFERRSIQRCVRARGGEAWIEIWPTGVSILPAPTFLTIQGPQARVTRHPEPAPPAPGVRAATRVGPVVARLIKLIAEHGPITGARLARLACIHASSITTLLRPWVGRGSIRAINLPPAGGEGRTLRHYMTPEQAAELDATAAAAAEPQPAHQEAETPAEPEAAVFKGPARPQFVDLDDGGLGIDVGGELVLLNRQAVERLRRHLDTGSRA